MHSEIDLVDTWRGFGLAPHGFAGPPCLGNFLLWVGKTAWRVNKWSRERTVRAQYAKRKSEHRGVSKKLAASYIEQVSCKDRKLDVRVFM